jgi:hypothetical protein
MTMRRMLAFAVLALSASSVSADVVVNCDRGQSLGQTLQLLPRNLPVTVVVKGTCSEYVEIRGFEGLTLWSTTGAVLRQPARPGGNALVAPLTISASRSITIAGLTIRALTDVNSWGVFVRGASADVRLRNATVEGGNIGIAVAENSQVSLAQVTGRDPGWATLGAWDMSSVHVEDSLFESTTGEGWKQGIAVGKATITIHGTRITNMQVGMGADMGGILDVSNFSSNYPREAGPSDVVIEGPLATVYYGVTLSGGGVVNVYDAKLRIIGAGAPWGGDTGGVAVSNGSTFNAGANVEISGSQGQGVFVTNNSFANLAGAKITGTLRGGLVVVNNSTAVIGADGPAVPVTQIAGATDVFCDATSLVTGGAHASFATTSCDHVLPGASVPLP